MSDNKLTGETLCDRITRESLRHGINWNDGNPRCYCGDPLPKSWDQHIAEAEASVFAPELTELATRAENAEAELAEVKAQLARCERIADEFRRQDDERHAAIVAERDALKAELAEHEKRIREQVAAEILAAERKLAALDPATEDALIVSGIHARGLLQAARIARGES